MGLLMILSKRQFLAVCSIPLGDTFSLHSCDLDHETMILDVSATITEAKYLYVTAIFYMILRIAYVTTVVVQLTFLLVVGCYTSSGLV